MTGFFPSGGARSRYQNFIGGQWVAPWALLRAPVFGQPFCEELPRSDAVTRQRRFATRRTRRRVRRDRTDPSGRPIADRIDKNAAALAVAVWDNGSRFDIPWRGAIPSGTSPRRFAPRARQRQSEDTVAYTTSRSQWWAVKRRLPHLMAA